MKIKENNKGEQIVKDKWTYDYILSEEDFYPPSDNRTFKTHIEELYDGEFAEYTEYIFDLYESEDWYEN